VKNSGQEYGVSWASESVPFRACEKYHKHDFEGMGKWEKPARDRGIADGNGNGSLSCFGQDWARSVRRTEANARIFQTMALSLKDLKVWQEAVALGAEVIRGMRQTNRREIKAITERTMVSAVLMAEHVAEGYGRHVPGEQRQLYRAAKRELLRLETSLAIARQADLLSAAHHAQLSSRIQSVSRLLSGFLVYLDREVRTDN